jgi:hypothetical protein
VLIHPDGVEDLQRRLADVGVHLPIQRCWLDGRCSRFRAFFRALVRQNTGLALMALRASPAYFCTAALALRSELVRELESRLSEGTPSGLPGRWCEQRARYAANRLLYLIDSGDYPNLLARIEDVPSLGQTAAVLRTLVTGDCSTLLRFPGPAVAAVASLRPQTGGNPIAIPDSVPHSLAAVSAMTDVALYGLTELPESWAAGLSDEDLHVVRLCQGASGDTRHWSGFTYGDEVRTLGLGTTREDIRSLLARKFDYREIEDLPALELGSSYS